MFIFSLAVYRKTILNLFTIMIIALFFSPIAHSQNWMAMPPYNTLWPLWSSILSPTDAVTGLPTPIVNSLTSDTVLPVQPALTWNPSLTYPWMLYNTPLGLAFYDASLGGIALWPPSDLIIPGTGTILPLTLPANYGFLPPTDFLWILTNVSTINDVYTLSYPSFLSLVGIPVAPGVAIPLTGPNVPITPLAPTLPAGIPFATSTTSTVIPALAPTVAPVPTAPVGIPFLASSSPVVIPPLLNASALF